jgi:hypothetical protein
MYASSMIRTKKCEGHKQNSTVQLRIQTALFFQSTVLRACSAKADETGILKKHIGVIASSWITYCRQIEHLYPMRQDNE